MGIGGIYYVAMAFAMPLRKAMQLIRGQRNTPFSIWWVLGHFAIAAAIVGALCGEYYLLYSGFEFVRHHVPAGSPVADACSIGNQSVVPALAALPFILLLTIVTMLMVLRWIVRKPPTKLGGDASHATPSVTVLQPALQQPL